MNKNIYFSFSSLNYLFNIIEKKEKEIEIKVRREIYRTRNKNNNKIHFPFVSQRENFCLSL